MTNDIFQQMADRWPSPLVARREAGKFSGGAISPKYLANLDSLGTGPSEKLVVAGHICYPATALADFLRQRSKQ